MATLTDRLILNEMQNGRLIVDGHPSQIAGACYEFRLGDVYYDLTEGEHPIQVVQDEDVLIKPGHRVVLITYEKLLVPKNILVRIVSKGSLFSIGLSPVATYADPGFSGNLGIVTQNISDKYIVLPKLEPIAKADFTKLPEDVNQPYCGQHGFRTQIWPIKHQFQKSHAEVEHDRRVKPEKDEGYRLLPQASADVLRALEARRVRFDLALMGLIMFNALALLAIGADMVDQLVGFGLNFLASAIIGVFLYLGRSKN